MYFKFTVLATILCLEVAVGQSNSKYITNYSPEINRSGDPIYAVTIDAEGLLYFATSNGVLIYDGENWQMFSSEELVEIRSLTYDSRTDRVYVGGMTTFGYLEKDAKVRYKYVSLSASIKSKYPFRSVWQIFLDQNKVMFQSSEGFFSYEGDSITLTRMGDAFIYKADDRQYVSQTGGSLYEWRQDSLYVIWNEPIPKDEVAFNVMKWRENQHLIFFIGIGIFHRDLNTNQITPFQHPWSDLVRKYRYYYGTMVNDSLFVMATWKDGIFLTDLNGEIIERWNTENGLNSNGAYSMVLDNFGKLWLATEYGISTIDLVDAIPNFVFKPQSPQKSKVLAMISNHNMATYTTSAMDTFRIDRRPEHLEFDFTTPGLSFFGDSVYQYILEGYDAGWSKVRKKNTASYEHLPNGEYTFKVKSVWPEGSSQVGLLSVIINEPWYAIFLGTVGYILIALFAVIILVLFIMNGYRHRQKLLIKLVNEKTKEIERHQQELMLSNKNLMETNEELDTFLYRSSHDLVSPVKSIKGLINLLKISDENRNEYIPMLEDRIGKLESLLLEINGYVKNSKNHSVVAPFNFKELIDVVWSELEFMDNAIQLKFCNEIDSSVELISDREGWRAIMANLLSNAIKYHDLRKAQPFIRISASICNTIMKLEIEDNGQGIPGELQDRLFEMFYRAHEISTGSGLGLFLVKKMVTKLNGEIVIESKHKQGTTVTITVPLSIR